MRREQSVKTSYICERLLSDKKLGRETEKLNAKGGEVNRKTNIRLATLQWVRSKERSKNGKQRK